MDKFKNSNIWIVMLFAIISIALFSSCKKDYLDKQPLDQLSTSTFWKTETDAMLALTGVYFIENQNSTKEKRFFDLWNQETSLRLFEATTDNGFEKDNMVTDFNNGNLTSAYGPVRDLWASSYVKITKCNNFLNNIDFVKMDTSKMAQIKAEVKTIRAFDYFYLAFLWGDVPLVTKVLSIKEANSVSRTSRAEVMNFVIKDLQESIISLPATRPNSEKGRITKGGALAILGRVFLAEKRWSEAIATYKKIIDLGIYAIDPNYKQLFEISGENSKEIILSSKRMPDVYGSSVPLLCLGFTWGGWHNYNPFNELVESYECTDGKPINESPLYKIDDPYKNRDPRLYHTLFINNVTTFKGKLFISSPDSSAAKYPDQLTRRPWSGYMVKKFCDEGYSGNLNVYGCDFPMIRYSEVLLSYLEATLESGTLITQTILDQTINKVRGRAQVNMPPVVETNPEKLRTILRRERRVELAWEGLRLFDLYRWKIAHINLNGKLYGMKVCTSAAAPNYTRFKVNENGYYFCEENHFRENIDYLWPIPQTERDINPNMTQNPGY